MREEFAAARQQGYYLDTKQAAGSSRSLHYTVLAEVVSTSNASPAELDAGRYHLHNSNYVQSLWAGDFPLDTTLVDPVDPQVRRNSSLLYQFVGWMVPWVSEEVGSTKVLN